MCQEFFVQIQRILRDDGMKKPIVLRVEEGDFTCLLPKQEISKGVTLKEGDKMVIDVESNSVYKL